LAASVDTFQRKVWSPSVRHNFNRAPRPQQLGAFPAIPRGRFFIFLAILRVCPLLLLAHAEIHDMFFLPAPVASEGAIRETQAQYGAGGNRKQLWIDN